MRRSRSADSPTGGCSHFSRGTPPSALAARRRPESNSGVRSRRSRMSMDRALPPAAVDARSSKTLNGDAVHAPRGPRTECVSLRALAHYSIVLAAGTRNGLLHLARRGALAALAPRFRGIARRDRDRRTRSVASGPHALEDAHRRCGKRPQRVAHGSQSHMRCRLCGSRATLAGSWPRASPQAARHGITRAGEHMRSR